MIQTMLRQTVLSVVHELWVVGCFSEIAPIWSLENLWSRNHTGPMHILCWVTGETRYALVRRFINAGAAEAKLYVLCALHLQHVERTRPKGIIYNMGCIYLISKWDDFWLGRGRKSQRQNQEDSLYPALSVQVVFPLKFNVKMMKSTKILHT